MYESKKIKKKCKSGEIEKVGYYRKGYQRKSFKRSDGTAVKSSYISNTYVPPTCIKDVGKPGKGPKTLPKPGDEIHLTNYGYNIHRPESTRRSALRKASRDSSILLVLRRLNLLRNYQALPENKDIMTQDVEYMKQLYRPFRKSKNTQTGGSSLFNDPTTLDDDTISDDVVDNIDLPESNYIELNTIIDQQKVCDTDGKCGVRNIVYELHTINDRQILYYTLGEKDINDILELDKIYLNKNEDKESVSKRIINNPGLIIGIKVDGVLQGYCQYEPIEPNKVIITRFYANKGYATTLYIFMEKYFAMNDYEKVIVESNISNIESKRWINFWYSVGYNIEQLSKETGKIILEKDI